jgi:hypothetical protein
LLTAFQLPTWLEHGGSYGDFDVGFTFEYESTDGWKEDINSDAQSDWDSIFMTNA